MDVFPVIGLVVALASTPVVVKKAIESSAKTEDALRQLASSTSEPVAIQGGQASRNNNNRAKKPQHVSQKAPAPEGGTRLPDPVEALEIAGPANHAQGTVSNTTKPTPSPRTNPMADLARLKSPSPASSSNLYESSKGIEALLTSAPTQSTDGSETTLGTNDESSNSTAGTDTDSTTSTPGVDVSNTLSTIVGTGPVTANGVATSTITITLKSSLNAAVAGITPTFSATNTGSTNTYGTCSLSDSTGVSTCTLKSTVAEVKTLTLTSPITMTGGTVTFQAGAAAKLAFTTQPAAAAVSGINFSRQPVVTIQDANGNTVTGAVNAITLSASTTATTCATAATGTIAATSNPLNAVAGVASFAAAKYNSASGTIYVKAEAAGLTLACSDAVVVSNNAPVITSTFANRVFPLDGTDEPLLPGSSYTFTATATDADAHTITYGCSYEKSDLSASDPGYVAASTDCRDLAAIATVGSVIQPAFATLNVSTGVFTWIPSITQRGSYKFTVTASDSHGGLDTETFAVTVRDPYTKNNLRQALDAQFARNLASPAVPGRPALDAGALDTTSDWLDLSGTTRNASFSAGYTAAPWAGDGSSSNPYQLACSGAGEYLDLGAASVGGQTKILVSGWFNPTTPTASSKVLLSTGGGTGNGIAIIQSAATAGKLQLYVGRKDYSSVVQSDKPVGYWRLDETAGVTAADSSGNAYNGTYNNTPTLAEPTALIDGTGYSAYFNGNQAMLGQSVQYVEIASNAALQITGPITLETWVKKAIGSDANFVRKGMDYLLVIQPATTFGFMMSDGGGGWHICSQNGSYPDDGDWHHVAAIADGTSHIIYVDGVAVKTCANTNFAQSTVNPLRLGARDDLWTTNLNGNLDETAVYNYALSAAQIKHHYEAGKNQLSSTSTSTKAAGPRYYYRLNEAVGATAASDTSTGASGWDGTYSGAAPGNPASFGGNRATAVYFDGVDDKITFAAKKWAARSWSGMAWIKTASTDNTVAYAGNSALTIIGDTTGSIYTTFGIHGGKVRHTQYTGAWFAVDSTGSVNDGTWHHVAFTHNSTNGDIVLYVDGLQDGTGTHTFSGVHNGFDTIGASFGGDYFQGLLAEVAIFNRVLTASEISAIVASSRLSHCESASTLTSGAWNFLSALWDGTNATLYINGHEECRFAPGTTFTPSTNLIAGAASGGSNSWAGSIADLKVYGTSDGSAVGDSTLVGLDYQATSNRFRTRQVPDINTGGVILHLDPANANGGLLPYSAGCGASDDKYADLSPSGYIGTLKNFGGCVANGWRGTGAPNDPYRLVFDGVNDYVLLGHSGLPHTKAESRTYSVWFKTTNTGSLLNQNVGGGLNTGLWLYINSAGNEPYFTMFNDAGNAIGGISNTATLIDGIWHNFVGTYDGSDTAAGMKLYIDGVEHAKTFTFNTGGGTYTPDIYPFQIGTTNGTLHPFTGDMGPIMVYSDDLTAAQVAQNYKAYRASYSPLIGMSGLQVWLAADTGVTFNGSNQVSQWADLSGNNNHFSQGTAGNKPIYKPVGISGKPSLSFDGTDDYLQSAANLNITAGGSIFIVAKNDTRKNYNGLFRIGPTVSATSNYEIYWQAGSSGSGNLVYYSNRGQPVTYGAWSAGNAGPSPGSPYLATDIISGAAARAMYVNGTSVGANIGNVEHRPLLANPAFVGTGYHTGSYLDGEISEVIVFNRAVTATERTLIHDYLGAKYGIAVP